MNCSYPVTRRWTGEGDWHLLDSASAQGIPLSLGRKKSQLLLLIFAQVVAVPEDDDTKTEILDFFRVATHSKLTTLLKKNITALLLCLLLIFFLPLPL